jgi:aspartyl-tRNA(Asn)/glutamyl-tRNA(Gln) amidotransferase subunit A
MSVPLALGSDTGGSVRVPSAFCGVVGFKGTWGTVSTAGMWPMGRTIDHVGSIARTPRDVALLQAALAGGDWDAPASAPWGTRIGVCADLVPIQLAGDVDAAMAAALSVLGDAGCTVAEVAFPAAAALLRTFVTIRDAETLDAHRRAGLFPDRRDEYGALTAARLDAAVPVQLADYLAASAERARLAADFAALFDQVDALVLPIAAGAPPAVDAPAADDEAWGLAHPFTVPFNLLGVPACVVRGGFDADGLPIGIQIVGRRGADAVVLGISQALFEATGDVQERWPDAA